MVEPHSSNFRVITTNYLDVRIFRECTVNSFARDEMITASGALGTCFICFFVFMNRNWLKGLLFLHKSTRDDQ